MPKKSAASARRLCQGSEGQSMKVAAETVPLKEAQQLLQELQVHQAALEVQNEELRIAQQNLAASRARFIELYELAPVGYLTVDKNGLIQESNLTAATMLRVERKLLQQAPLTRFIYADDQDVNYLHLNELRDNGASPGWEIRLLRSDGSLSWVFLQATYVHDDEYRIALSDINRLKQVEEELVKSQRLLTETAKIGKVGGWVLHCDTGKQTWTEEIYSIHEVDCTYEPDLENGLNFYTPASRPIIEKAINVLIEHGEPFDLELDILTAKGNLRSVRAIGCAELEKQIVRGFFQDVTARRATELSLEKAYAQTVAILQSTAEGILDLDTEGNHTFVNDAAAKMLGYTTEELVGRNSHNTWHKKHIDGSIYPVSDCPIHGTLRKALPCAGEDYFYRKDGTYFIAEYNSVPIFTDSRVTGVVCSFSDITARKQAEEEKARLEEQLRQAQKMEVIGQLAGGIAHDLNNILTAIIGFSSLLDMRMDEDDPDKEYINQVLIAADRAAELIRSLLTFSRQQIMKPQPIDLNNIVKKTEKFMRRVIPENIEFIIAHKKDELMVYVDSGQIEQVLLNLVTNARDAMPSGGLLSIETDDVVLDSSFIKAHGFGEAGTYALLTVADNGTGMSAEVCQKVFEPFFTTKEVGKGTGLGLSMVYDIIKQHNGFVTLDSEPGKGTSCRIYLPLIQEEAARAICIEEVLQGGDETILVVDDNPSLRELLKEILTNFGYKVIIASDGMDAVVRFKENESTIQLVILDVIMPKLNGKEVYDAIKVINPSVKAIFMSGYAPEIINIQEVLDQGLVFINKPLTPKQLLKCVRSVLDQENN